MAVHFASIIVILHTKGYVRKLQGHVKLFVAFVNTLQALMIGVSTLGSVFNGVRGITPVDPHFGIITSKYHCEDVAWVDTAVVTTPGDIFAGVDMQGAPRGGVPDGGGGIVRSVHYQQHCKCPDEATAHVNWKGHDAIQIQQDTVLMSARCA